MSQKMSYRSIEQESGENTIIIKYDIPQYPDLIEKSYDVLLESGDDDRLIATCLDLQGVVADGKTPDEVMKRIRIVIEEMLEVLGTPNKNFILRPILTF